MRKSDAPLPHARRRRGSTWGESVMSHEKQGTPEARAFADRLDQRLAEVLAEVEQSEVAAVFNDPNADPRFLATVLKYILLEVFSYGPHVTEATFTAIGR